ncbi:MAG: transposase [Bacteroidetes bacterium]|nr:transposase [Bacteroidota bacterium]
MTFSVVNWVDVFLRKICLDIIRESLKFCQKQKGLILRGYVIMSNHVHVIFQAEKGDLSDLVRDFKVFTAKEILKAIQNGPESRSDWMLKRFEFKARSNQRNSNFQFWEFGNHPEEIFSEKFFWTKLKYIHMNSARSGLVSKASDYVYSSASNYVRNEGIVDVAVSSVLIIDFTKPGSIIEINEW